VNDQDLACLNPSQWLNDEIINFYGAMILGWLDGGKESTAQGINDSVNFYKYKLTNLCIYAPM